MGVVPAWTRLDPNAATIARWRPTDETPRPARPLGHGHLADTTVGRAGLDKRLDDGSAVVGVRGGGLV